MLFFSSYSRRIAFTFSTQTRLSSSIRLRRKRRSCSTSSRSAVCVKPWRLLNVSATYLHCRAVTVEQVCQHVTVDLGKVVDRSDFGMQTFQASHLLLGRWHQNEVPHPTISELYSLIKADGLEATFPNIEIALQIYLAMMSTNCTGEHLISKLKIVKNHLRSCVLQLRLSSLSVMSTEQNRTY